ncbi:MAG TPA: BrnT family toxin [Terriglobales bacterium]|nr:BrnT family toxin [Terriglobales bacterium]HTT21686.1 BrnT family toxin [Candidatus Sulfotelmatobacter sp.]
MDIEYELRGIRFRWDADKAKLNREKHGVTFEQAAQVFFDPFLTYQDASRDGEQRDGAVGCDFDFRILFVVHLMVEDEYIRIISAYKAEPSERKRYEDGGY